MSPKIAWTKTRAKRRKPTVRTESRMQRVRTERRELHSAVGSERCLIKEVRWSVPDGFTVAPDPFNTRCKLG